MKRLPGSTATSLRHRGAVGHSLGLALFALCLGVSVSGCAVVAVADAGVSVAAAAVKVGANAVGAAADVAGAGVRAVTGSGKN